MSFTSKFWLYKSPVASILPYGCEGEKDPGFENQVHEETSPHLLPGAQDQRLGPEQDRLPRWSTGTSSGNY